MAAQETKLGGNIALVGFEVLEPAELLIVKKIVGSYVRKMCRAAGYKEMRLTLQQRSHGKTFKHEVDGQALFVEGRFGSNVTAWNLYTALAEVCERILAAVQHARQKEQRHEKPAPAEELPKTPTLEE